MTDVPARLTAFLNPDLFIVRRENGGKYQLILMGLEDEAVRLWIGDGDDDELGLGLV